MKDELSPDRTAAELEEAAAVAAIEKDVAEAQEQLDKTGLGYAAAVKHAAEAAQDALDRSSVREAFSEKNRDKLRRLSLVIGGVAIVAVGAMVFLKGRLGLDTTWLSIAGNAVTLVSFVVALIWWQDGERQAATSQMADESDQRDRDREVLAANANLNESMRHLVTRLAAVELSLNESNVENDGLVKAAARRQILGEPVHVTPENDKESRILAYLAKNPYSSSVKVQEETSIVDAASVLKRLRERGRVRLTAQGYEAMESR